MFTFRISWPSKTRKSTTFAALKNKDVEEVFKIYFVILNRKVDYLRMKF